MNKFKFILTSLAIVGFTLMVSSAAQAQATRTWVSGVGDDANPCSRTAPCKTFAGAISKTAKDGEISVLDPGGFGTVTITKSITINGTHGAGYGSILAAGAGVNGVNINITDVNDLRKTVRLISIDINGVSSGSNGVRVLAATNVYLEDCRIDGFTNRGIDDFRSNANGKLVIKDTIVRGTVQSAIVVIPGGAGSVNVIMENVSATGSTANSGYAQSGAVKSALKNCIFSGNFSNGVFGDGSGEMMIEACSISNNGTGISATSPVTVRLNASIIHNNTTSINVAGQPRVFSTGNNTIIGNGTNNQPTGVPAITQS